MNTDTIIIITPELLRTWGPCTSGLRKYTELLPKGATLPDAMAALDAAGHGFGTMRHDDWSYWLFQAFRNAYPDHALTACGYRNSGNWNSGDRNSGYRNSGNWNSGDRNSGYRNSGYQNSGDWNSGYQNSGNWNSGNQNSGYQNSGNWNSGNQNSGFFNTDTPMTVRVFGLDILREVWEQAYKPSFLQFELTYWVDEAQMTDADKVEDPHFHIRGGQLRTKPYKRAFQDSWDAADPVDRERIRELPGFNADMFYEISGIDLRDKG